VSTPASYAHLIVLTAQLDTRAVTERERKPSVPGDPCECEWERRRRGHDTWGRMRTMDEGENPSFCRATPTGIKPTASMSSHTNGDRAHRRRVKAHKRNAGTSPTCRPTRTRCGPTANMSSHTDAVRAHRQPVDPHVHKWSPPLTYRATRTRCRPTANVSIHTNAGGPTANTYVEQHDSGVGKPMMTKVEPRRQREAHDNMDSTMPA